MFRKYKIAAVLLSGLCLGSCQNFDSLEVNPNVAGEDKPVPSDYLLGRISYEIYNGGGVTDGISGNVFEGPWGQIMRWNQYTVSNDSYYGGQNTYNWTNTASTYAILKNVIKMEEQAQKTLGQEKNAYAALGKFFRAYLFVWYTQRVGDIPMTEAGLGLDNLTPVFNTQKEVYAQSLKWLDEANTELAILIPQRGISTAAAISGDIYFNNDLTKWQKVVNAFKMRVLISLSKRATDNADLAVKEKFAEMLSNPAKYPLMSGNEDNMSFRFNANYNQYPLGPASYYNNRTNIGAPYMDLLTKFKDPRVFVVATPAPALLTAGKTVADFSVYKGSNPAQVLPDLSAASTAGAYSFISYARYYKDFVGPEAYTIVGYPELCLNIAEGINRGWAQGSAALYYTKGITASLKNYGVEGQTTVTVGDVAGVTLGTVDVNVAGFLAQPEVAYKGNNADGLKQILEQKYIAFFQNSGWEAFYNQRRTGVPALLEGTGTNATGKIPRRWLYPADQKNFNSENAAKAIQSQYAGQDNLYADMWLVK
ncbi:SusD/RagB family nutrient-binding outer membrane lipoprotein [Dyadobacter luteus]|uniref:SusD/RagB family nutrient-binding outer membrane lipoprotein n=2 Tax=Dyadobacter luteus TaxID=2259619 RepID=A0A3D8YAS0_9BACT|nr:SusD/RagB family nutrient-binding outer membrane lipoprotein [Dyadobacter luteus]